MKLILGPKLCKSVIHHIDDCLVISRNFDNHVDILNALLKRFKTAGLTVYFKKFQFLKEKIKFVGHEISPSGVVPVPSKLRQVSEVNFPKTLKQLISFLGMCS
jgi:hypothetical protein